MKTPPLGVIAGNGEFPLLVVREALRRSIPVVVAAIREEADPALEALGTESLLQVHWLGLGQLGRLLRIFHQQGVRQALMAGQVRHARIFARESRNPRRWLSARPDMRMLKLLVSLRRKNTVSLIGAVAEELAGEGIELLESTFLLRESLASEGVLTRRRPNRGERADIRYGRPLARQLARLDLGQTIVVKDQAVVAVEAMEGTDEAIRRACRLAKGGRLTLVKSSRPQQDMRFDVPVLGVRSLKVFQQCHVSAVAIDAGRTLILNREKFLQEADRLGLALVAG